MSPIFVFYQDAHLKWNWTIQTKRHSQGKSRFGDKYIQKTFVQALCKTCMNSAFLRFVVISGGESQKWSSGCSIYSPRKWLPEAAQEAAVTRLSFRSNESLTLNSGSAVDQLRDLGRSLKH